MPERAASLHAALGRQGAELELRPHGGGCCLDPSPTRPSQWRIRSAAADPWDAPLHQPLRSSALEARRERTHMNR